MRKSGQVYAMTILLIGCLLAMTTQCRPVASYRHSHAKTSTDVNSTSSDDDSKIFLQFCIKKTCASKGGGGAWLPDCYCCQNLPNQPCFDTEQECRGKCPSCDPKCPPAPATELLHA